MPLTVVQRRPNSLPPAKRLHYPWEYRRFFSGSEVFRLRECVIFRIRNDVPHFRLGITIKARGKSVDRNKVKRQAREFFRENSDLLGSFDYNLVIPATKKLGYPYPKRLRACLEKELKNALTHK